MPAMSQVLGILVLSLLFHLFALCGTHNSADQSQTSENKAQCGGQALKSLSQVVQRQCPQWIKNGRQERERQNGQSDTNECLRGSFEARQYPPQVDKDRRKTCQENNRGHGR